jgi:hypothetical protein
MITFKNAVELKDAMLRAETAHAKYEKQLGHPDPNWAIWYADFIQDEQHDYLRAE